MTTTAVLPRWFAQLATALLDRRAVAVSYHGRRRVVCPHALGSKNNKALVLAYQIGGETSSGALDPDPNKRWRCMFIDEIDHVADDDGTWQSPRNYNPSRPFPAVDHLLVAI